MDIMQRTLLSQHRTKLQALIRESDYKTIQHFCRAIKIDELTLRLIIEGQLIPSKNIVKNIATACRTTPRKVVDVLY